MTPKLVEDAMRTKITKRKAQVKIIIFTGLARTVSTCLNFLGARLACPKALSIALSPLMPAAAKSDCFTSEAELVFT